MNVPLPEALRGYGPDAPVLSTDQLAALAGVSFRRIDYWHRRGLLRSSALPPHSGSGNYRRWTLRDLAAVQAAVARMAWGMTVEAAWRTSDPGPPPPPPGAAP